MNIIDLHCDVLYKLWASKGALSFRNSPQLDANLQRLKQGQVRVQCFAIFIPPEVKTDVQFQVALQQIDYFYKEILEKHPEMQQIKAWDDLFALKSNQIGAILTLEGVDCIGNDIQELATLYNLGVRLVGLTWNVANLAADGIGEERGAGLTSFGKEIIAFNNRNKLFTDVSHLSERGFWELLAVAKFPIASHSNSKTVCNHQRNLTDEQALALFEQGGMIHLVFHPPFVTEKDHAQIGDLIKHIDHFCSLGGVKQIGFGSDFDGIEEHIIGLEHAAFYPNLINTLLHYYSEDEVKGFASENFLNHLPS